MEENMYAWSFDRKYFVGGCPSLDMAIEEAMRETDGEKSCYVGIEKTTIFNIDADNILEIIDEQYMEQSSEWYDGYLDRISLMDKALLESMLEETINKWMEDTHNYPTFFTVTNIEEIIFEEWFNIKAF